MRLKLSSNRKIVSLCYQIHSHEHKNSDQYQPEYLQASGDEQDDLDETFLTHRNAELLKHMDLEYQDKQVSDHDQDSKAMIIIQAWEIKTLDPVVLNRNIVNFLYN